MADRAADLSLGQGATRYAWSGLKGFRLGLARIVLVTGLLAGWELLTRAGWLDPFFWSSPGRILRSLWQLTVSGDVVRETTTTLGESLAGLVIGSVLGIAVGLVLGQVDALRSLLDPLVYFFYSLPRVAIAPLFIVAFGIGVPSKIATAAFTVFFVLLLSTVSGVLNVEEAYVRMARIMGATPRQITLKIIVPSVMGWVFAGLRLAVSMAFLSAVVAEFAGSTSGLGYRLQLASTSFDTSGVFAWMVVLGIVSMAINLMVSALESRMLRWKPREKG